MPSSTEIANRIVDAVLAQKLAPGSRLGENDLAQLFGCSRTLVREALTRLAARGIVTVSARRGWYVIEPSVDEAREAFEARRVLELGMIRNLKKLPKAALQKLKAHIAREKASFGGQDVSARSFLLGDFHVCLAEAIGNGLLADTLRDYTARTTLIAMLYQSSHQAEQSCVEHQWIVRELAKGDFARAEQLMAEHLASVEAGLQQAGQHDPLEQLRAALSPVSADCNHKPRLARKRAAARTDSSSDSDSDSDSDSSYLGKLL